MQVPSAGPLHGLNWVVPPNFAIAALVSCPGSLAGRGYVAFFGYLFRREIARELAGSGHRRAEQPGVQRLVVELKAGKEEQLVVVLVEAACPE